MTVDFFGNRRSERFRFVRVSWPEFEEGAEQADVTGGSLEFGSQTDLKVTGSAGFSGWPSADVPDLVRIYYGFTDDAGARAEFALATCFASVGEVSFEGAAAEGEMALESTLKPLASDGPGYPYTAPAGTAAVALAEDLCLRLGLPVSATPSDYRLATDHTFESGDAWLAIVNWLLSAAGYASATPDAYGTVILAPYVPPSSRTPVASLATDSRSVIHAGVKLSDPAADAYNAWRLTYQTDEECLWASSRFPDPGVVKSGMEQVDELEGATRDERIGALKSKARQRLLDNAAAYEHLRFSCAWLPMGPDDAIHFDYVLGGRGMVEGWEGCILSMNLALETGAKADIDARRLIETGKETVEEGGAL